MPSYRNVNVTSSYYTLTGFFKNFHKLPNNMVNFLACTTIATSHSIRCCSHFNEGRMTKKCSVKVTKTNPYPGNTATRYSNKTSKLRKPTSAWTASCSLSEHLLRRLDSSRCPRRSSSESTQLAQEISCPGYSTWRS